MKEIWLSITGFEGLYEISNLGNIKYLKKMGKKEGLYKPLTNPKNPYPHVRFSKERRLYVKYYHRLVAQHFVPNPFNLPEVNHIDGNKLNCKADNLEWCTKSYNKQHAIKLGLWKHSDSHKKATADFNRRTKSKTVYQYDKLGNFIQEFPSTEAAAISIGGSQGNIVSCCNNKKYYSSVKGFVFKYIKS